MLKFVAIIIAEGKIFILNSVKQMSTTYCNKTSIFLIVVS